jgi:diaminohydroxyphosphoribosylaminopyrimidine deaminase / 5-amino-6-(5-phosphoribosylamino)uracil reductase
MSRCLELAAMGKGLVAPNPMVGAVLVNSDKIIGEGFHHHYGGDHAEVIAVKNAIENGHGELIPSSLLYVNLEPCTHFGKTPPCTELILTEKIKEVVIGNRDPFRQVDGKGIEVLRKSGVKVTEEVMPEKCIRLNASYYTFHLKKRPFIILKFARTADGYIAPSGAFPYRISNEYTDVLVHKWRSEEQAIMIGTNTAMNDNPELTVRSWHGKNPVRIVIDQHLRLNQELKIFNDAARTIIYNSQRNSVEGNKILVMLDFQKDLLHQMLSHLYSEKILSVMVEGGSNLLQQFINAELWDEARIITASKMFYAGLKAPELNGSVTDKFQSGDDSIVILENMKQNL